MEGGEQRPGVKWEGKARGHLRAASADRVWPLLEDFVSAHKWILNVDTCYIVEGEPNKVGCVRYCAGSGDASIGWAKERLTAVDPGQRTLSYEIVDNNAGFGYYAATLKVLPDDVGEGCTIEWSFVCDPVGAFTEDQFKSYIDLCAQTMVQRMEAELRATE